MKWFIVSNLHSENNSSNSLMLVRGTGGETFDIGGVIAHYCAPLVDAIEFAAAATSFHVHDIPSSPWGNGVIFKGNGPPGSIWTIDSFFVAVHVTATEHWRSGTAGPLAAVGRLPNGAAALELEH